MDVIAFSPDLERIIDAGAQLERVATGFLFVEGPVWDTKRARLIFSDIPADRQYQWREGATEAALYREPTGNSNGLTIDHAGALLNCEHSGRRVSRLGMDDGSLVPLAARYNGKRLNSPNDLVVHSSGAIYFTDPPYGVRSEDRELNFQGVYRLDPDGTLTLLADDFDRPNGIALNADETVLFVDDTSRQHVRAFDVGADGSVSNGRVHAEMDPSLGPGVPDGLKVDIEGNLYMTGPAGIWVFNASGKPLGVLRVPEVAANLAWGGADKRWLYITASTSLYRVRLKIAGVRRF
ncbi:SMP-30/gluconolactonase/LRE family protein [Candidatus Poribacteria bacterium]|nr:SMP-30/gluconolactonase/LRE family protein [Candidatus Poribacteria bacterium]